MFAAGFGAASASARSPLQPIRLPCPAVKSAPANPRRQIRADCLVTPCPLCHTVLDAYQPNIERQLERRFEIPILHVSQLMGLALGLSAAQPALPRHMVDAGGVLAALAGEAPSS